MFQPNSDTAINAYFIKNDYGLIVNDGTGEQSKGESMPIKQELRLKQYHLRVINSLHGVVISNF